MDRQKCRTIREAVDAALEEVGKKLGLSIKVVGNATFSSTNMTMKVEAAEIAEGGAVMSREAQAYQLMAPMVGIPASTLGWTFTSGGKTFTIRGWNNKAHRMPILCDCNGRGYKFPVETVRACIAIQHKEKWAKAIEEDSN